MARTHTGFRIDPELLALIKVQAQREGRSVSQVMERLLWQVVEIPTGMIRKVSA